MDRSKRLDKLFRNTLEGHTPVSAALKDLFLEAICSQADRVTCISEILGSSGGLMSLKAALRYDLSPQFLNGHATHLLNYLQAPEVEMTDNGRYLEKILLCVVESLWPSLGSAVKNKMLQSEGERCFAWLLLRLVSPSNYKNTQFRIIARDEYLQPLLCSQTFETRLLAQKIENIIGNVVDHTFTNAEDTPGCRHDNDFVDFRLIAIMPTADEINSQEKPFLRTSSFFQDSRSEDKRISIYLDNQFRLLREDMLSDMREELQVATGKKEGKSRGLKVKGLDVLGAYFGPDADNGRLFKWGIKFELHEDFSFLRNVKLDDRKECLQDQRHVFPHRSLVCLLVDNEVVAFPTVYRDDDLLSQKPPTLVLQFDGDLSTTKALSGFKSGQEISVIGIGAPTFAFEPVLKAIQAATASDLPFSEELLFWQETSRIRPALMSPTSMLVCALESNPHEDLQPYLYLPKSVKLDASQANCFITGLTQRVSLIQGPPGTGKSFIGALLAKTIYEYTDEPILVVCFTNHALDQFLEQLMDIDIPGDNMVRLGSNLNTSARTAPLLLHEQTQTSNRDGEYRFGEDDWRMINFLKHEAKSLRYQLGAEFHRYNYGTVSFEAIMKHLKSEHLMFFTAFRVPGSENGMVRVTERGVAADELYLLKRWSSGRDAGIFAHDPALENLKLSTIWNMLPRERQLLITGWKEQLLQEELTRYCSLVRRYNKCVEELDRKFSWRYAELLRRKRIIGCTTTGAAKYREIIQAASPSVLIVEEAGEILESHVLTALGKHQKQLILIGDHLQLRPKVHNHSLTVEKGDGYDLNMSMFERLILKLGYPHGTLSAQHRMRPEISALVRHLTYPDLVDEEGTKNRPNLKGVRDNIVFINHDHPEDELGSLQSIDNPDSATSSKQNTHEARMVLKIVQYLGQQGYGTDDLVILTPYLGQLQNLRLFLKHEIDPVLNDLDSYDLLHAGLTSPATAQSNKKQIRIATIDNYQGEESDIVIASLTRSNPDHDIGFMASPQRVNVLLSRARNALIMIGNVTTFMKARKGKELWNKLFSLLKDGGHVYDGLPVRCERHQNRTADLKRPLDFERECPDGGCTGPCGADLDCKLHKCPSKCHQLNDHSKLRCEQLAYCKCDKGHNNSYLCYKGLPFICHACEKERKRAEKLQKEVFALKQKRDQEQEEHDRKMAELDIQIEARVAQISQQRDSILRQDMKDLRISTSSATWSPPPPSPRTEARSSPMDPRPHRARYFQSGASDESPSPPGTQRPQIWKRSGSQVAGDTGVPSAKIGSQDPTPEWRKRSEPSYGSQVTRHVSDATWLQQGGSLRERSEPEHAKLVWRRRDN